MNFGTLEDRIAKISGRDQCILLGNATTAIYVALQIIQERYGVGEVLVPATICPSVPEVVIYAGFKPVFADVVLPDCTMDPGFVRNAVNENTRAVIPTHAFGNAARISELEDFLSLKNIPMIEDAVPATGGTIDARPVGSFGDFSIHSFGRTKIAEAGGGGALVTNDQSAARRAREIAGTLMPLRSDASRDVGLLSHRNMYMSLVDLLRFRPASKVGQLFEQFVPQYRDLYLRSLPSDSALVSGIANALEQLPSDLEVRRHRAAEYERGLSSLGPRVTPCAGWHGSSVIWRYTLLVNDSSLVPSITRELWRRGLRAWNLYWSMAQIMYDQQLPNADHASPRLLNLGLDSDTPSEAVLSAIEALQETLR